jgi:hypothetical protein
MKVSVLNRYIDSKIRLAISEKKTVPEIISILEKRIETNQGSTKMRQAFRDHMNEFTRKRINDILFIEGNFKKIPVSKLLNAIQLKDKISGVILKDIDLPVILEGESKSPFIAFPEIV